MSCQWTPQARHVEAQAGASGQGAGEAALPSFKGRGPRMPPGPTLGNEWRGQSEHRNWAFCLCSHCWMLTSLSWAVTQWWSESVTFMPSMNTTVHVCEHRQVSSTKRVGKPNRFPPWFLYTNYYTLFIMSSRGISSLRHQRLPHAPPAWGILAQSLTSNFAEDIPLLDGKINSFLKLLIILGGQIGCLPVDMG